MKVYPADILLPDFSKTDGTKWACVACDQYTSEPEYWARVEKTAMGVPSTFYLMLPEVWLGASDGRIARIHGAMREYLANGVFTVHPRSGIYLERIQSDGKLRRGLVCAIDLEDYDYSLGSISAIRPTERTVVERIPPRLAVRRGASLEMPHVMLLADDPEDILLSRFAGRAADAYSFELAEGGGSVRAAYVSSEEFDGINESLGVLSDNAVVRAAENGGSPITLAVGDGNHSLATARAMWTELRASLSEEEAAVHPARYALVEICNLHEPSLAFEPIYRLVENVNTEELLEAFNSFAAHQRGRFSPQSFSIILEGVSREAVIEQPEYSLPVASLQHFLDAWLKDRGNAAVDYIHGEDTIRRLAARKGCAGFIFEGMRKSELFYAVEADGVLPRKTFSMGHAADKRYYIECRKITD